MKTGIKTYLLAAFLLIMGCTPNTPSSPTTTVDNNFNTSFAVISDYGVSRTSAEQVAALVKNWNPPHIITSGDNIQQPTVPSGETLYDYLVGRLYCEYLQVTPGKQCAGNATNRFWPTTGNHDYNDGGYETGQLRYQNYFIQPLYYDIKLGQTHIFFLDSEGAKRSDAYLVEQQTWLQQKLQSSTSRWQIVVLHHPPYSSNANHGPEEEFRWNYSEWGADLILSGHAHLYERINKEIPYITAGIGGASLYSFGSIDPDSEVRYNKKRGALRIEATAQHLRIQAITFDNELIDDYTIR